MDETSNNIFSYLFIILLLSFSFLTINQFSDVNGQDNSLICEDFMDPIIIVDENTPSIYPVGTVITNEGIICSPPDNPNRFEQFCITHIIDFPDPHSHFIESTSCMVSTLSGEELFQFATGTEFTPREYCTQINGVYQLGFPTSDCIVLIDDNSGLVVGEFFGGSPISFRFLYASCANEVNCNPTSEEFPPTILPISLPFQENRPPSAIAEAIPNPATTDEIVTLDGSKSSDPDGNKTIESYEWRQIDSSDSQVTLNNPSSITTSFNAPTNIPRSLTSSINVPLEFELTVTDDTGLSDSDTVSVDIQCSAQDLERIQDVKQKMERVLGIWNELGYVHSINGFNIWVSGNQNDILPLDVDWLRDQGFVKSAEKINEKRIERGFATGFLDPKPNLIDLVRKAVQTGETQILQGTDGKWDRIIDADVSSDYYFRIGSSQLTSQATISINPLGGNQIQIVGKIDNTLQDTYDFNPGDSFGFSNISLEIFADDLNLLKKCETAKDYDQKGEWTKIVNVTDDLQSILKMLKTSKLPFILIN